MTEEVHVEHQAAFLATLQSYTQWNQDRLEKAYQKALDTYRNEMHWTGESLIQHVHGVLHVLLPFQPDEDGIIACVLHHYLQLGGTLTELEEEFGPRVRNIVSGIHLLSHVSTKKRGSSVEDMRLMLLTVSDEIQTILITLCDRCYLLEISDQLPRQETSRLCSDVLDLFAPVAARLGMYGLKHRLESQAFVRHYESDADHIYSQIEQLKDSHGMFLNKTSSLLSQELKESGLTAHVEMRQKQPYSTFRKLHQKSVTSIEQIYDLFALRVIVDTPEECYQALGIIHRMGKPVANRFKDYIAFPKPNGYQSLHTTLLQLPEAPRNTFVEVQIRTHRMHQEAEFGIAAHWMYKEKSPITGHAIESIELTKALTGQEAISTEEEKVYADHIFVLTPKGDVIELPEGATPLDFAFQIHSNLGLAVRSARVNGNIVPLGYELQNGDIVEIQKQNTPNPSPQWLNILKMSSSRSKLKRYLYAQDREHLIFEGKKMMNEELKERGLPALSTDLSILRLFQGSTLNMSEREELLMKVGQGAERITPLLYKLDLLNLKPEQNIRKGPSAAEAQEELRTIALEGGLKLPTRFAKCCKPEEDKSQKVVGVINRNGYVMVHRTACKMLKNANSERMIKVWWK